MTLHVVTLDFSVLIRTALRISPDNSRRDCLQSVQGVSMRQTSVCVYMDVKLSVCDSVIRL